MILEPHHRLRTSGCYRGRVLQRLALLLVLTSSGTVADEIKSRDDSSIYTTPVVGNQVLAGRLSFENADDLPDSDLDIRLSGRHFKDGSHSMHWRWSSPDTLIFNELPGLAAATAEYPGGRPERYEPSYVPPSLQGGIKLWVYREKPAARGFLTFGIGTDPNAAVQNPKYGFRMYQNFTGWRALWVHFEEDTKADTYDGDSAMTALAISPSEDLVDDEVYFDLLQLVSFMSKKRHSDVQFQNNKDRRRDDKYRVLPAWQKMDRFIDDPRAQNWREVADDIDVIEKRLEYLLLGSPDFSVSQVRQGKAFDNFYRKRVDRAKATFASLNLTRNNGALTGLPLFSSRDEHPGNEHSSFQSIGEKVLFPLAIDYRLRPTPLQEQQLLDLLEYYADQGFAAGSAVGTTDHMIRVNPYANAIFLMRDTLQGKGLLDAHGDAILWFTRFGDLAELDTSIGENSDHVRGGAGPKLIGTLLMEQGREKVARLHALRDYLIHTSNFAPGFSDTIKPDYSIFHHAGAYQNVYGVQAVTTLALFAWLFQDTAFAFPEENVERLRATLLAQFDLAADFELHPGVSGRFPYRNSGIDRYMLPGYAFLAVNDNGIINETMAAAFAWAYERSNLRLIHESLFPGLNYYGTYGTLDLMQSAYNRACRFEWSPPEGHSVFPYAGTSTHKRRHWAATVRGFSKYVWDWESGHKIENPYGRYMSFGALLLFSRGTPLTLEASGIDLDGGFHWSFVPGATTKALSMEKMTYEIDPTPDYVEGKHRNFTNDRFLGGVSLDDRNGFFAMSMHDTVPSEGAPLFDESFGFHKSFLFVDNEIIALGSGISSDDTDHNVITTLFQNKLTKAQFAEMSPTGPERFDGGRFTDQVGNHYIVPHGNRVIVEATVQKSLKPGKRSPIGRAHDIVSAPHIKAWIDHGRSPDEQEYEYKIIVQPDIPGGAQAPQPPTYRVHQKDKAAHIVEHRGPAIMAYALFQPATDLPGIVNSTDTPLLIMTSRNEGRLRISIADPDLRLGHWPRNMSHMPRDIRNQPAKSHTAEVRVAGHWRFAASDSNSLEIRHDSESTILQVPLGHGLTRQFLLTAHTP